MDFDSVAESPSVEDARRAANHLLDVVIDFPFVDQADRSAWLALVLTMTARSCIDGQVPLFCVTANVPGAGKSMLVDLASIIAYGHTAPRTAFADDSEMRKRITAILLEGSPAAPAR